MRIVIATDLEGISGVCVWEQTRDRTSALYQDARRLLMGDINAAVEGCLAGGATEVLVVDGHGGGFNIVPEMLHPQAQCFTGRERRPFMSWGHIFEGLDAGHIFEGLDAAILLGCHAMAGTADGILRHTQSSAGGNQYWYNGRECGEIAQEALIYGHFGIPVVMVTGDSAATREATELLGQGIVTVAVKQSLGEQYGVLMAPATAHKAIHAGACAALERVELCQPFRMELPIEGRLRFKDAATADGFSPRRATRVDERTFEARFESALEILSF
jgi:D-amino peptidase